MKKTKKEEAMELQQFSNGIQDHKMEIAKAIELQGFYTMHEDGYSYSVGFNNLGYSELIMFKQPANVADELFGLLFHFACNGMIELASGADLSSTLTPPPTLRAFSDEKKQCHFYATRNYLGTWDFDTTEVSPQILEGEISLI